MMTYTPVQRLLIQKMTAGQRVILERLRKTSHVVKAAAAKEKPPQLRIADKSSRSCGTCSFYSLKGRCNMFGGYPVKASQVCSDYVKGTPGTKGVEDGGPGREDMG